MRVEYAGEALSDLEQIEEYYAERAGGEFADRLIERLVTTFERLAGRNPRAGRLRDDLEANVRALPVLPYLIFYELEKKRIYVIRILHGHRNVKPPLASLLIAT